MRYISVDILLLKEPVAKSWFRLLNYVLITTPCTQMV